MATIFKGILKDVSGNELHVRTSADQVVHGDSNLQARLDSLMASVTGLSQVYVVADIAARDAIASPKIGDQAWVKDATADDTVSRGAAIYLYESADVGWTKAGEVESLDAIVTWSAIKDKPVTDEHLTDAVDKRHAHANGADVLDKLSADAEGRLLLDGAPVDDGKIDVAVLGPDEEIPAALRSSGVVFQKLS